jgi:hypothetical protein
MSFPRSLVVIWKARELALRLSYTTCPLVVADQYHPE